MLVRAILYAIIAFLHDSRDHVQPPLADRPSALARGSHTSAIRVCTLCHASGMSLVKLNFLGAFVAVTTTHGARHAHPVYLFVVNIPGTIYNIFVVNIPGNIGRQYL